MGIKLAADSAYQGIYDSMLRGWVSRGDTFWAGEAAHSSPMFSQ
jgi:hypothetical protein